MLIICIIIFDCIDFEIFICFNGFSFAFFAVLVSLLNSFFFIHMHLDLFIFAFFAVLVNLLNSFFFTTTVLMYTFSFGQLLIDYQLIGIIFIYVRICSFFFVFVRLNRGNYFGFSRLCFFGSFLLGLFGFLIPI